MIAFCDVSFRYKETFVIRNFSEHIKAAEHVCLIGESGAGKSTLLKSIIGLTHPCSGQILISEMPLDATHIQKIRQLTAWVPQEVQLPYIMVKETVEAPFLLKANKHIRLDTQRMFGLFDQMGLAHRVYEGRMNEISGGEKQRLMIILAVLLDKKVILLDEPTSALDKGTTEKLTTCLSLLPATILAITHDPVFAASFHRSITLYKLPS